MFQSEFEKMRVQVGMSIDQLAEYLGYTPRTLYRWENGETSPRKVALNALEKLLNEKVRNPVPEGKFKFIDLFAGIGGLRRGFEFVGGECVFTSEWNKHSVETYIANYPYDTHEVAGDITQISPSEIPEHDVLLAGFPCQPFSIAGVSKKNSLKMPHGFRCNAQGTLFFDVARVIEHHRPKAFLLENVKNLKSHDKGRTYETIYRTLTEELGYQVQARIIDAKSFVPQHRERIFIVGFKDKNDFDFDNLIIPHVANGPKIEIILHPENESEQPETPYTTEPDGRVSEKYILSDKLWAYLQNYAVKHKAKGNGFGFGLVGPNDVSRTLSARYYKDGSEILIKRPGGSNPRRLTPRECARLMGFDAPGQSDFQIPVSDTQAYRQFGNAVVVPVVEAVAKHMSSWLLAEEVQQELALYA